MGKYKHEGQGRNISISGGQQRKDLFKDMSGGYNAMGDSNQPLYKYNGSVAQQRYSSPAELTTEGKEKILASDANDAFKSAIAKQPLDMKGSTSPTYKTGCTSGSGSQAPYQMMGDPNKKMDRLSAKHKSLYDRFEMGQTSEKEEQKMFRLEDRMDKVGARINKKSSPANNNGGTRNSGDAQRKMSPEEKAKLIAKNKARIAKEKAFKDDKKAKGVYPKDK
jgi:hypothetical protein